MVIWLIGLSGAGKSVLANEMVSMARPHLPNLALVDGDVIREVFGNDLGHTLEDRRKNAGRICRLCQYLESQNILVVCAVLSLFPESRSWNRENYRHYYEVFIDTPMEHLIQRDSKGLYKKALNNQMQDVAGVNLEFKHPENPDLIIKNDGEQAALLAHAPALVEMLRNA